MATRYEVYKCEECGNIVLVLHGGQGELVCCGQPMIKQDEKTAEMKTEKHVPCIEQTDDGIRVFVGSTEHPMTEEHYIEWIAVYGQGEHHMKFLEPGDKPEAVFNFKGEIEGVLEYCNLHGLWINSLNEDNA